VKLDNNKLKYYDYNKELGRESHLFFVLAVIQIEGRK
jgi:hypothetical protein